MDSDAHYYFEVRWLKYRNATGHESPANRALRKTLRKEPAEKHRVRDATFPMRQMLYPLIWQELHDFIEDTEVSATTFDVLVDVERDRFQLWGDTSLRLAALAYRFSDTIDMEVHKDNYIPCIRLHIPCVRLTTRWDQN